MLQVNMQHNDKIGKLKMILYVFHCHYKQCNVYEDKEIHEQTISGHNIYLIVDENKVVEAERHHLHLVVAGSN